MVNPIYKVFSWPVIPGNRDLLEDKSDDFDGLDCYICLLIQCHGNDPILESICEEFQFADQI